MEDRNVHHKLKRKQQHLRSPSNVKAPTLTTHTQGYTYTHTQRPVFFLLIRQPYLFSVIPVSIPFCGVTGTQAQAIASTFFALIWLNPCLSPALFGKNRVLDWLTAKRAGRMSKLILAANFCATASYPL